MPQPPSPGPFLFSGRRSRPPPEEQEAQPPLSEIQELRQELREGLAGVREDIRLGITLVVGGLLTLVLILVFGLLATRGVDPRGVAEAVRTVYPPASTVTSTAPATP